MAAAADAAAGRAQHRGHPGRRPRLRRPRLLRLGDRHAQPRRAGRRGPALHELPRHPDVLAEPRLAADRREPPPGRVRHGGPRRRRLPRLRHGAAGRHRDAARDPARPRLRHADGRQVAPGQGLRHLRRRAAALVALPAGLRPLLRLPRRVHEPPPAAPADRGQPPGRGRPVPRRLLPHRRSHRPRHLDDPGAQGVEPRPALLPLLRPRGSARAAAGPARGHRALPRRATTTGWDELRRRRYERQLELGVLPPGTPLAPRNTERDHDVVPWDDLTDREQELFARHMEVYAAMVDRIDQSTGRLLAALDELGRARQHHRHLHLRQRRARARARRSARPRTTCTCCRATTSTPTTPAST